ncbi:MAG TPA: M28 family metallopeptidase [Pyrinomonadaceae bacterium]|nr:M28 family metallopeptidase [Pyrinomonadaceae bacterium]
MFRRALILLLSLSFLPAARAQQTPPAQTPPAAVRDWWSHVAFLADDRLEGRDTGSAGYRAAAEYVAREFRRAGLKPAGTRGFMQAVRFRSRRIVEEQSSLALVREGGAVEQVVLGDEATFSMRAENAPQLEAPLVFAGYGLRIPEASYDDLAGLDLRGKVVVVLSGGPSGIAGPLLSHYQSVRWEALREAGALGAISIPNPRSMDIPWDRSKLARFLPALTLSDPALDDLAGMRLNATVNPARAEKLFKGSGHTFAEILETANAGKQLPRFALPASVRSTVKVEASEIESDNVAGVLPGTDKNLKNEYVVLSAHLDHLGKGQPTQPGADALYNGAMDNASGIATLIETARALRRGKTRLRRSVVFLAVTAEEKGLLGSRYYAAHPTVGNGAVVANVNVDMFLPLFPLRGLVVQGLEESNLADDVRRAGSALGVQVLTDPEPERNAFIRSDQYSFIRRGVPAVSLKVGYTKGSPEQEVVRRWRTERYHAPADDLTQPIDFGAVADFNRAYLRLVEEVANRDARPAWNATSFFRRFAR